MRIQTWAWKSSFVPEFDDTAFRLITDKTRQLASRMIMSVTDPIRVVAKKLRGSPPSNSIYQRQILLCRLESASPTHVNLAPFGVR
jgi:hypothetical protein